MKTPMLVVTGLLAVAGGCVAAAPMQSTTTKSTTTTQTMTQPGTQTMRSTTPSHSRPMQSMRALSAQDKQFLRETAQSNLGELQLSPVVMKRAASPAVKQFAQRMVRDHTRAHNNLKTVAAQLNYPLPKAAGPNEKAVMKRLSTLHGAQFDAAYKQEMVRDHNMDIAQTQREIIQGQNPRVKAIAQQMLPILQEHLRMATALPSGTNPRTAAGRTSATGQM